MAVPKVEDEACGRTLLHGRRHRLIFAEFRLGIEQYEPPSSELLAPTTFVSVSNIKLDPALFINFGAIHEHLDRLYTLADLIRAAHTTIDQHEARIQHELSELWEDNPDIRKRGLRGGTARKQRRMIGKYVRITTVDRELAERRLEVEKMDYFGRNRLAGLRGLRVMFEEAFCFVRDQQYQCEDVLRGEVLMYGVTMPILLARLATIDDILAADNLGEIEDIEDMLETFHQEYDTSL
ncbi:uncharacterized protein Z519_00648 [Cladophialophora bantiana CBS 173.52]|uniref:Uncharacterized protein n=1 Tax=Cladophialophora bantiana (strain ATCC 10958 / CBS 173.52 / CDC B-1940 / NIH 8579) TaxID=1442370 RepID=A0A0D2I6R9_CLAB1|nr:uncharacterized protein Z519_00648 [Cladophialophora bantiana CBS 173.52]KIW98985.1 hypothetical protein Z519_00648 [Cladophialophora bantiana CBS 173.52]